MILALAGPSGSGKSTIAAALCRSHGAKPLLSYTTRPKRASDVPGELENVREHEFDLLAKKDFLWHVQPFGSPYRYGTTRADVNLALTRGLYVALLIGEALPMLYGYALGKNFDDRVRFVYLALRDVDEQRRRLALDPTRTDLEQRIISGRQELAEAERSSIPYRFVDAYPAASDVLASVRAHIK